MTVTDRGVVCTLPTYERFNTWSLGDMNPQKPPPALGFTRAENRGLNPTCQRSGFSESGEHRNNDNTPQVPRHVYSDV